MNLEIEWTGDYYDCETCGGNGAEGAIVTDGQGKIILELEPIAHCYDPKDYSREEVLLKLLEVLGYKVSIVDPYVD
jgi:hypothetical protein